MQPQQRQSWLLLYAQHGLHYFQAQSEAASGRNRLCTHRPPPCNCRVKSDCPLGGACRESSIVYKATMTTPSGPRYYIGCCETEVKTRFYNHKQSLKNRHKKNATALSKAYWDAKDAGTDPVITWSIMEHARPYCNGGARCNLCLAEKLAILSADQTTMLNKRSDLTAKCRHTNKFKLKNLKGPEATRPA